MAKYKLIRVKGEKELYNGVSNYRNCTDSFPAQMTVSGAYKIDLTKEERSQLEADLFLEPNDLAPKSPFWDDFLIKVGEGALFYDDTIPSDRLEIAVLRGRYDIAKGWQEAKKGNKYRYALIEEEAEAKEKVSKIEVKMKAITTQAGFTNKEKVDYLTMIGAKVKGLSAEQISISLYEQVEQDPAKFLSIYNDPNYKQKVLVRSMISYGVIDKKQGAYYINGEIWASSEDEFISKLKEPQNGDMKAHLMKLLKEAEKTV